jgi:predicted O-linked N-acetylglucosamine transferase (SPINDLY family)
MYRRMDYLDLVAKDADDYVRIALSLGTNRDHRAASKRMIAERSPVLFDDKGAIRAQERVLEELAAR